MKKQKQNKKKNGSCLKPRIHKKYRKKKKKTKKKKGPSLNHPNQKKNKKKKKKKQPHVKSGKKSEYLLLLEYIISMIFIVHFIQFMFCS